MAKPVVLDYYEVGDFVIFIPVDFRNYPELGHLIAQRMQVKQVDRSSGNGSSTALMHNDDADRFLLVHEGSGTEFWAGFHDLAWGGELTFRRILLPTSRSLFV